MRATSLAIAALVAASIAGPTQARDPLLSQPIDCTLGETCFLQALFDHDPSPEESDSFCGKLTRDDHGGTDFALPNLAAMRAGVDVLAAAPGTVIGTRDSWPDISVTDPNAPDLNGQDCGNGVAVRHGGGWVTQYCHLKLGSIAVTEGQRVAKGTPLGEVGLSGSTTFPHLHLSVFKDGAKVDPFAADGPVCNGTPRSLWQDPLPTPAGGILTAGFAGRVPDFAETKDALQNAGSLSTTAPALLIWVSGYQSFPGDTLDIRITNLDGVFHENTVTFTEENEAWQRFSGRRYTDFDWPSGPYTATLTFRRGDKILATRTLETRVE